MKWKYLLHDVALNPIVAPNIEFVSNIKDSVLGIE